MIKQRIMYVCSECAEGCPEACGHYDRTELRVMPDGAWLCESCFDNNDDNEFLSWGHLPAPEEYGHIPASAQGAITGRPTHYRPLPKGVRCRCLKMWREADGGYWCCNPKDQATLDKAPAVSGSAEPLQCLRCGTVDAFGPVSKERQQHAKPLAALIQAIEAEARRYAEMYPQSSDGRNTFIIFADWVARLEAPSISEGERQSLSLEQYKNDWRRVIVMFFDHHIHTDSLDRIIELAELNGLFDPIKAAAALPSTMSSSPPSDQGDAA